MAERALASDGISRLGNTGLVGGGRRPRIVIPAGQSRLHDDASGCAFVPLHIGNRTLGVLRVDGPIGETAFRDQPDRLLVAFANEAAQGMQRAELSQAAAHAQALMQADEMKSALMTSISHDLKTPLAGIKASVSSLLDATVHWSPEDRRAFLETIDSQADRLNHVISDILDLNRIEAGAIAPQLQPVDVRSLFKEVRERTSYVATDREVRVATGSDLLVRCDESLIVQALVNLVENAAKYSVTGGAITLRSDHRDTAVEIQVEDEGPGIAPDDLPHVFERFYRAADQSRRVKGSGLGLAIVKGFVTLSGGSVRVESSPEGTRFVITLPAAAAIPAPA
jgi:two-component system sensor histidine kinase KdpD